MKHGSSAGHRPERSAELRDTSTMRTTPRSKAVDYRWRLREVLHQRGMESIDMVPLLAERGVAANGGRVYRLITRQPKRLDMQLLAALCDILSCSPSDLIDPYRTTG